ncbi:MAG: nickel-type superoxide dismutase maturation protease [Euryarchaeota archaeon]|nr:nickel-type superoxide dismutase maturation protease [Euryarchaeota archaeon]
MVKVVINGDSMLPTLKPGDIIKFSVDKSLKEGDVVLAFHPLRENMKIVKRIKSIVKGRFFLEGDNPDPLASDDSHNFGTVSFDSIIGKMEHS